MTQRSTSCRARDRMTLAPSLAILLWTFLLAGTAFATDADPPKSQTTEVTWQVTVDGKPAGKEDLKTVHSGSGKVFASGSVQPPGKGAVRVITHQQRDAGGPFRKYRRQMKERLGEGIFAFRKGSLDRIVGLNQYFEPAELPHIGTGQIWDRKAWHTLARWWGALEGTEELKITYLDISRRARREATATPMEERLVTNRKKERVALKVWKLAGLEKRAIEAGWLPGGALVFVSDGSRELLLKGYSWKEPPPPEPEPVADSLASDGGATSTDGSAAETDATTTEGVGPKPEEAEATPKPTPDTAGEPPKP